MNERMEDDDLHDFLGIDDGGDITKKYTVLISMMIHIFKMSLLKIQLRFLSEEVRNVPDEGKVHKKLEDMRVFCIRMVELRNYCWK